ncbi:hypothetical protein F4803DRAFT_508630, partial [Xylaria telfairii]
MSAWYYVQMLFSPPSSWGILLLKLLKLMHGAESSPQRNQHLFVDLEVTSICVLLRPHLSLFLVRFFTVFHSFEAEIGPQFLNGFQMIQQLRLHSRFSTYHVATGQRIGIAQSFLGKTT